MKRSIRTMIGILAILLAGTTVHAELQLVVDFEGLSGNPDGQACNGVLGGTLDTQSEGTGNSSLRVQNGSNTMSVIGHSSGGTARAIGLGGIDNPIDEGETGIGFFRFRVAAGNIRPHMGLVTDNDGDPVYSENTEDPTVVPVGFKLVGNGSTMDLVTLDGATVLMDELAPDQWFNCWIVADNGADTFDLYLSEAEGPGLEVALPAPEYLVEKDIPFNVPTTESLAGIILANPVGSGQASRLYVDDVWWDGDQGLTAPMVARVPVPANDAEDVPSDVVLNWKPSPYATTHDVYLGMVFDNVAAAERTNPLGVLVSQGQDANSYDPDIVLAFGQTYYWRIDEVNAAPDYTITKGSVWSFTVEPYAYVIDGVVATSNAAPLPGEGPENVVNGSGLNVDNEHSTEQAAMWTAVAEGDEPAYIQFEFDRVYKLHEMTVWNHNIAFEFLLGIGIKDVTVEYSADGLDWTVLGDVVLAQAPGAATYTGSPVALDGIAAKFVRLVVGSNYGGTDQFGLSEVRFMQIPAYAREPQPADGAVDVAPDAVLSWRSGRDAVSYDVYLGTDADALDLVGSTTQASFNPGGLNYGATYSWKVVAINGDEAWDSAVWSFSTQAYAVVDDFEAYTDDWEAGEAIFQTWVDGWDDDNNGSQVGYAVSPFAELTIIRSGAQAMPLSYNNGATAKSEATRSFVPARNWTANGLKSLSLWFQGAADNTGQLYVKINGVKVPYPGDPADIAKTSWLPFNVDLSTVAGAQSVSSLVIGVEGAQATGVVYVDDIRLYPQTPELIMPVEPDAGALLAHYAFEGNANDSSGNGLNGALVDAQVVAGGVQGMAVQIDDGGYVDLGNPPSLDFATEDWAISAWFKTAISGTGDANKGTIIGKGGDTGGGHRWCLIMSEATEGVVQLVTDDDSTKYTVDSLSVTNDDEWHSVVGQRSGGTSLEIYIDGTLEGTTAAAAAYDLSGTVQHNAYIGVITDHNTSGVSPLYKTYEGLVDDVRIYHQSLTEGEILWLNGETLPRPKPF